MPRFEKGSQEAKDYMASIRNARKQPNYVPPANKKLTKKQKEPKNIAVHKQRKTKSGWSKKQTKKQQEDDGENIQMNMEEEPAPATAYQRKKRQIYATEDERKEAIKKQKRDYAKRKRDKVKAAKGSGLLGDIKMGLQKTKEYVGAVVYGRGNIYPPKVRGIIKKLGEHQVVSAELRRSPVQSLITKAMDLFTFGQFSKNMSQTPYDKLFHLQIILTLDNGVKLLVEKNEVINMDIGSPPIKKGIDVLPVSPFSGDVLNNVLEKTKTKMGDKAYFDYNAENNNCQDFISSLLSANGWGDANDFAFVKQDTKTLFKGLSGLAKTAYTLTELGERANVAMTGRGNNQVQGEDEGDTESESSSMEGEGILDYLMGTKTKESQSKKPLIPRPLPLKDTSQVRSQVQKNHYAIRNQIENALTEGKINETERRHLVDILDPPLGFFDDSIRPTMELYKNQNAAMEALAEKLSKKGSGLQSDYVSSMEGEGIAEWIRTKLGVKQGVKPADYRERLDKMITIAKAEQQKSFIDQRRRDKGLPALKPKPIGKVAPAPVYNDMIFDDDGELMEGSGLIQDLRKSQLTGKKGNLVKSGRDLEMKRNEIAFLKKYIKDYKDRYEEAKRDEEDWFIDTYEERLQELDDLENPFYDAKEGRGLKSFKSGSFGSDYVVQSVLFKKDKYSLPEAKKWLKDNKYKSPKVDETENMLRFRQLSPSVVDKKGYTEYHNKPLGLSGIELVIAYRRQKEERMGQSFKKRLNARLKNY